MEPWTTAERAAIKKNVNIWRIINTKKQKGKKIPVVHQTVNTTLHPWAQSTLHCDNSIKVHSSHFLFAVSQ